MKSIRGLPKHGIFSAVNCIGSGSNAICAAVGKDVRNYKASHPLLAQSIDGGNTWSLKSVKNRPKYAIFDSTSGAL